MDIKFIEARFEDEIKLTEACIEDCKKYKVIALYSAVQFVAHLEVVIKQLEEEGIKVISSQPERTGVEKQIIGCDAYYDNLKLTEEPDAFLYIGDGMFHPRALILAQKDNSHFRPVISFDPISSEAAIFDITECASILKKCRGGLIKFKSAKTIGVYVTTKPGQQQLKKAKELEEKYPDKSFYYFLSDNLSIGEMENFPFIEIWINTACPRIGFDDSPDMPAPLINLMDALKVEELLSKDSLLTRC